MLGEGAVGKSTLTISFITGRTQSTPHHADLRLSNMFDYDPTIEESFTTSRNVDSQVAHMSILDTAGQEELAMSMRDQWIRASDGFILVFSLTSMESFKHLNSIFLHIQRTKEEEFVPMVLIGNKCDLQSSRQVAEEDAAKLAQLWRCKYFECSATKGMNITEPYHQVVREMRKFYCIADGPSSSVSSYSSSIYSSWKTKSRKGSNSKTTASSRTQGKSGGRKNSLSKDSGGRKTSKADESNKKSKWMCTIL